MARGMTVEGQLPPRRELQGRSGCHRRHAVTAKEDGLRGKDCVKVADGPSPSRLEATA